MQSQVSSPRLARLLHAVAGEGHGALRPFWDEMTRHGTPLIEPLEGEEDRGKSLVTFIYRESEPLLGVELISLISGLRDNELQHLPGTDLWYRSEVVANDIRATYQFGPHTVARPPKPDETLFERFSRWRHDPLNPKTFVFPRDEEDPQGFELIRSVLEMPEAPIQPWLHPDPDAQRGDLALHRFHSRILDNERRVYVYTPPGYEEFEELRFPLLLLFDGWAFVELVPIRTILDNLIAAGTIPPIVAVLPDSLDQATRMRELLLHDPFNRFLAEELVPWIRSHYRVTDDPAETVVGGASAGGLAAAFSAFAHPDLFGNILSMSGAFLWAPPEDDEGEWLTRQIAEREVWPARFYLGAGILESKSLRDLGDGPSLLTANRHLRTVLRAKSIPVRLHEFAGGHDYIAWQGELVHGLRYLLGETPAPRIADPCEGKPA